MVITAHQRHWDEKYAAGNTHSDYNPDQDLVELIHHFKDSGLALDVACGPGRNSFILAEHGLDVDCMDFSLQALNYLNKHRETKPEAIAKKLFPLHVDLSSNQLQKQHYDAIIVIRYLDRSAFSSYIEALKPGGRLFIKAFNINHLKRKPRFNPEYLLQPGELINRFNQMKIIHTNDSAPFTDFESVILVGK